TSEETACVAVRGNGAIMLDGPLNDRVGMVLRGSGAFNPSELSAILVGFNGRPMSGRFDVFAGGEWAFVGSVIGGESGGSPAKSSLSIEYLNDISRPSGQLMLHEIALFAPGRTPSRIDAQPPTTAILNLGEETDGAGWHPVEAGQRGGTCWMGEMSDVFVNVRPAGSYRIVIPEMRPLVADLIPKLKMFLDGEPVRLDVEPTRRDSSAYMAQGQCVVPSDTRVMRTLRISFPKEDVKSPMELGLNPDLRPLTIAVRCIVLTATAS
ncbi:MAG: hypothetical protein ACREHV_16525, partial [Rhizomicrobium sp.]